MGNKLEEPYICPQLLQGGSFQTAVQGEVETQIEPGGCMQLRETGMRIQGGQGSYTFYSKAPQRRELQREKESLSSVDLKRGIPESLAE